MHGGQAIGKRNTEGERVLEFAFADELVGNTWFKKKPKHLVTYQSGNAATQIDFKFEVGITESQEKLPTFYWLPKLHKRPYKARFIANSSSCTTTSLSKVLTSCLTAIKNHWIKHCEKTYEREGINYFWSIKNSTEILNKLKSKGFQASTVSTYDFSTLYTTLPHNLIRNQLVDLIENTFRREELFIWPAMKNVLFSLLKNIKDMIYGLV